MVPSQRRPQPHLRRPQIPGLQIGLQKDMDDQGPLDRVTGRPGRLDLVTGHLGRPDPVTGLLARRLDIETYLLLGPGRGPETENATPQGRGLEIDTGLDLMAEDILGQDAVENGACEGGCNGGAVSDDCLPSDIQPI